MSRGRVNFEKSISKIIASEAERWIEEKIHDYIPSILDAAVNKGTEIYSAFLQKLSEQKDHRAESAFLKGTEYGVQCTMAAMLRGMSTAGLTEDQIQCVLQEVQNAPELEKSSKRLIGFKRAPKTKHRFTISGFRKKSRGEETVE